MKSISKFISLALLIAAATACNTKEIDKPDIPDQPQISGNVRFTASMKQTRVEYSVNGDKLHQRWEVDDFIYGFYGDNPVRKVTLKVTEVDEDTEQATLEATDETEGAAFIAALKEKGKDLDVGLLYTGRNNESVSGNTIYASMQNQSTGKIPAYLVGHLDEIAKDEESGDTFVYFDFENECAILEIQSLTGIKETIDLESIEISGVEIITSFEYSSGSFSISSTLSTSVRVSGSLKVDSNGNIVDAAGNRSCIRIAVKATSLRLSTSTEITVTATANDASSTEYSSSYKGVLHPGCYIICAKDVVAKTEDGFYFTTVSAAFDRAEYLNTNSLLGDKPNIVTLLKSEIDGLGCPDGEDLSITYPVTLELNGCTLNSDKLIKVKGAGRLTINDKQTGGTLITDDSYDEGTHLLDCSAGGEIIVNSGIIKNTRGGGVLVSGGNRCSFTINGGEVYAVDDCAVYVGCGTLTITGGRVHSDNSYAIQTESATNTIISGTNSSPAIYSDSEDEDVYTIYIEGGSLDMCGGSVSANAGTAIYLEPNDDEEYLSTFDISGGTITSTNGYAVNNCEDAISTISGGKITSTNFVAVNNEGDLTISGGDFYSKSDDREYVPGTIENYSTLKISGGKVESDNFFPLYNSGDGTVEITGGKLISYDDSAIYSYGDVTIGETVENEISIISSAPMYSNYTSAAIYMLEGSNLEIYSGTVTSSVGTSAIILEGAEGNITGGVISNKSNSKETVQILDGASCIISGGLIYSEGDIPTVACRAGDSFENTKLTVEWPKEGKPNSPSAGTGPIIYAKGAKYFTAAPISSEYSEGDNTAVVTINGGYLITSNVDHAVVFYVNDEYDTSINLDLSTFGNFYSNATKIHQNGSSIVTDETKLADNYYELLSDDGNSLGTTTGHNFKAEYVNSGFAIPVLGDTTGFLYEIKPTGN